MDLNKLKTFVAVAQEGSVTRAAHKLLRTQPAVTQAVHRLERELGLQLFQRRNARVYLTPEGQSLFQVARESLDAVDHHVAALNRERSRVDGLIRVAVVPNFGSQFILESLPGFRARHPGIDFQIEYVANSAQVEGKLLANEADLGVIVTFRERALFDVMPLAEQHNLLVASRAFLAARPRFSGAKAVADCPETIDFSADFVALRVWLRNNGVDPAAALRGKRPAFVIQDSGDAKEAALKGLGLAVLPERLIAGELRRGELREVVPGARRVRMGYDLALRKKRKELPTHTGRLTVALYVEYLQALSAAGWPARGPQPPGSAQATAASRATGGGKAARARRRRRTPQAER